MDGRERLGNCLLGALRLMVYLRSGKLRMLWKGRLTPHFYVVAADGTHWHFRLVRDILPPPLCFLCFCGRYDRL